MRQRCGSAGCVVPIPGCLCGRAGPGLHGDAAADFGEGLVGQLDEVEVINYQGGVWAACWVIGGLEDRAHVDGDEADLVSPGWSRCGQPVDHHLGGAALDLPEQPLPTG
jgi:hypothetical protein